MVRGGRNKGPTNRNCDVLDDERLDGYEVGRDDGEVMTIDEERIMRKSRSVNNIPFILLAPFELYLEDLSIGWNTLRRIKRACDCSKFAIHQLRWRIKDGFSTLLNEE